MHQKQSGVCFMDKTLVPRKTRAIYLGTVLDVENRNKTEITHRISEATAVANRMKLFWNKAETTKKWKIQVLNAIIRSKVVYGLEALQLVQAEKAKLDAFHIKCRIRFGISKFLCCF